MRRLVMWLVYGSIAAAAWALLGLLVFAADAGAARAMSGAQLATAALLFIAPGMTFVPLARRLRAPLNEVEALAGWASFGFVLTFLAPRPTPSLAEFLIFLLPLTVA